jgi:DNA repair protein RadA/Sms
VASDLVALGEIGLSGELRPVSQLERRLGEAARLGFKCCLVPKIGPGKGVAPEGIRIIQVATLREAVKEGMIAKVGPDDV